MELERNDEPAQPVNGKNRRVGNYLVGFEALY
jgi:hypothetical protein